MRSSRAAKALTGCRRSEGPHRLRRNAHRREDGGGGEAGLNASTTVDINAAISVYNDVVTSITNNIFVLTAEIRSVQRTSA